MLPTAAGSREEYRIGVVGGGAAALAVARQLERSGHFVTLFDTFDAAQSAADNGTYERQRWFGPQSVHVADLAEDLNMATAGSPPRLEGVSAERRSSELRRATAMYLALRETHFPDIDVAGLAPSSRALAGPARTWCTDMGFESAWDLLWRQFDEEAGGGRASDLPALYFVKYLETTGLLSLKPPVLGHAEGFTLVDGLAAMWERLSSQLKDIRSEAQIERITRRRDAVVIDLDTGTLMVDYLIAAGPLHRLAGVLNFSAEEQAIADAMRASASAAEATGAAGEAFFHSSADLADGICERLEALQGHQRTFHIGVALAGQHAEAQIAHANHVARRYFGASSLPHKQPQSAEAPATEVAELPKGFDISADEIRAWLVERVARYTWRPIEAIDPMERLETHGLSSLSAYATMSELSDWLGVRLADNLLFRLPTIDAVARSLADPSSVREVSPTKAVITLAAATESPTLRSNGRRPPTLFILGGNDGNVNYMQPLAEAMMWPGPVYGLRVPAGVSGAGLDRVEKQVDRYLPDVLDTAPDGPYVFLGHSFGGLVAYELAVRCRALGAEVCTVALDTSHYDPSRIPSTGFEVRLLETMLYSSQTSYDELSDDAIDWTMPLPYLRSRVIELIGGQGLEQELAIWDRIERSLRVNLRAARQYNFSWSDFPVLLVKSEEGLPRFRSGEWAPFEEYDRFEWWTTERLAGLQVSWQPGNHFSMLREPHSHGLAAEINRFISAALYSAAPSGVMS